jgi:Domain of unknown function (DUF4276)
MPDVQPWGAFSDRLMHIEFLVEDFSTQAALRQLLPKILAPDTLYDIRFFQGKADLLAKLPNRLAGYRSWIAEDYRIVVLLDRDNDDCKDLKSKLEAISNQAGLSTKTTQDPGQPFQVLNRIMIEELEAWFFGDIPALSKAYSGIKPSLATNAKYRHPDAIKGGTWEALERELQSKGHFKTGLDKVKAAREIATLMEPTTNRSPSFQAFLSGLQALTNTSIEN